MVQGSNPPCTTLIPAAANRETVCPAVAIAADVTVGGAQVAAPGIGPGQVGGGPPISEEGHEVETPVDEPKAARQGSEAR